MTEAKPPTFGEAQLPVMLDLPGAQMLGIGRTLAYELVRTGNWPTPILRLGRLIKVPSGPLVNLLATGHLATSGGRFLMPRG